MRWMSLDIRHFILQESELKPQKRRKARNRNEQESFFQ